MKSDSGEKGLLKSVERGEWKSTAKIKLERTRYARHAKAKLRRDRKLSTHP